ncbi:cytochrome P450 2C44-like [Uloborus diversus]|uniref:cytochrome P450 2C44-like n=1 Tax=Uloborus diversus TaxID=327109 RepID=UPI0024096C9E|nr:cytochrome P450 2C44-like [Uloborus diversus]
MSIDLLSTHLLYSCFILFVTWMIVSLWKKNSRLPPGPWGYPILGYYPFLTHTPHLQFTNLAKSYGNVFSFRTVGGTPVVILNGAKSIKEVFINRSDEFIGRPVRNNLNAWVSKGYGITQEEGPSWKEQRRFFLQSAKNFGFGKLELEGVILQETRHLLNDLRETEGQPTDMKYHIAFAANNVISQVVYSKKYNKTEFKNIWTELHYMTEIFAGSAIFLVGYFFDLAFWLLPNMRRIQSGRDSIRQITDEIIREHEKSFDAGNPRDYVDAYLKHMEELKKNGKLEEYSFNKVRLEANVMNIFFEGTESVSVATFCLLSELSKRPDVQILIQNELDSVIGRERLPSWTDRQNLPHVVAAFQELFRVASPFLITPLYCNFNETTIEGYKIPARSLIVANLWSINIDPLTYPNPEKFDPERFLGKDGKILKHEGPFPFGLGKRSCLAEPLAHREIFIFIVSILQSFKLLPGDTEDTLRVIARD